MTTTEEKKSYERINYALRPAKCIERKMLCESFRLLSEFRSVKSYRYIGFGSTYFSDFQLFHRALNLTAMESIEKDVENEKRFLFNRPYNCITMRFGESKDVLKVLPWDSIATIAWLDYDGRLDVAVLSDIKTFFSKACPGSVLVISVNAHPSRSNETDPDSRRNELIRTVGVDKVPASVTSKDLREWGTAKACREIITNEISEVLVDRNGGRPAGTKLHYKQLYNFHYADGAKMLTVGGILYDEGQTAKLESCGFSQLDFYRADEVPFLIDPPNLTYREMRYFDSLLPSSSTVHLDGVPEDDIKKYGKLYRHFPMFAEAEL